MSHAIFKGDLNKNAAESLEGWILEYNSHIS